MAGVDVEPVYCSCRSQFDDCPVIEDMKFPGDRLLKPLPVKVSIMSTGFPSVKESAIATELPFEALCRLRERKRDP
jgi:hypothetical protein